MRKRAIEAKANITEDCLRSIKLVLERTLMDNESLRKKLEAVTIENNNLRSEIEDAHKRRKCAESSLKVAESEVFRLNGVVDIEQAEIERLNGCVKSEDEVRAIAKATIQAGIGIIKAEAIKEFAERLKERAKETVVYKNELCVMGAPFVNVKDIDNLLKEMVGE